jgi:hypothetical protein
MVMKKGNELQTVKKRKRIAWGVASNRLNHQGTYKAQRLGDNSNSKSTDPLNTI